MRLHSRHKMPHLRILQHDNEHTHTSELVCCNEKAFTSLTATKLNNFGNSLGDVMKVESVQQGRTLQYRWGYGLVNRLINHVQAVTTNN
jgi:hypothetical protein